MAAPEGIKGMPLATAGTAMASVLLGRRGGWRLEWPVAPADSSASLGSLERVAVEGAGTPELGYWRPCQRSIWRLKWTG